MGIVTCPHCEVGTIVDLPTRRAWTFEPSRIDSERAICASCENEFYVSLQSKAMRAETF